MLKKHPADEKQPGPRGPGTPGKLRKPSLPWVFAAYALGSARAEKHAGPLFPFLVSGFPPTCQLETPRPDGGGRGGKSWFDGKPLTTAWRTAEMRSNVTTRTYYWDFFGPRAEGTAAHFAEHLRQFLGKNELTGCTVDTVSDGDGHFAARCVAPETTWTSIERGLRPRRRLEPGATPE